MMAATIFFCGQRIVVASGVIHAAGDAHRAACKRIIDATANRMGITEDKVMMNISRYGNTTAATIPLLLWDYEKQLKKGDNIIMAAFGGGFTWGAVYVKWAYNSN